MMAGPLLTFDASASTPPYEQVRRQLADAVARGDLVPGARLPSVRQLAADRGLAPGTVACAYRELEQAGIVATRGRGGTVVSAGADAARAEGARLAAEFARTVNALGLDREDAIAMVRAAWSP